MKKVLSKLWVMVTLIAVSVVLLGTYVYLLARPISYGMWYSASENAGVEGGNVEVTMSVKFIDGKRALLKTTTEGVDMEIEMWYINDGSRICLTANPTSVMAEEEFDTMVEGLKADEAEWNAIWNGEADPESFGAMYNIGAFNMRSNVAGYGAEDQDNLVCDGAISLALIMGMIEIALITFAVLSVIYYIKGKKAVVTTSGDAQKTEEIANLEKVEETPLTDVESLDKAEEKKEE